MKTENKKMFDGIKEDERKRCNCAMLLDKSHFACLVLNLKKKKLKMVLYLLRYKIKSSHKITNIFPHIFLK